MTENSVYQRHKRQVRIMIDSLPDDGAAIIVIRNDIGRWIKRGIAELRSAALSRRCRAISIVSLKDCDKIVGLSGPVVIDWSFTHYAKPEVIKRVERMIQGIHAVRP